MNLLEALINAIRLPELRNKILFTGGILVIFRLFANISIPGATQSALATLFNQQALQGSTPSEAFQVKCDSTTTTPSDQQLGVVNIVVAVALLKPAEFVVITISQLAGQTA